MLNVPEFIDDFQILEGKGYVFLLEILYDATNANPDLWQYMRLAKYNIPVTITTPQYMRKPVVNTTITFTPFPIADTEITASINGSIPGFDLTLSSVGREVIAILENYEIEHARGRVIFVHPDKLAPVPCPMIAEAFTIASANADAMSATLSCVGVNFDPLLVKVPAEVITQDTFPGILGNAVFFM